MEPVVNPIDNAHDLRHSVTLDDNRSLAATPGATPAVSYGAIDGYGLPASRSKASLSGADLLAGVFVLLIILGPLVTGAMHSHG